MNIIITESQFKRLFETKTTTPTIDLLKGLIDNGTIDADWLLLEYTKEKDGLFDSFMMRIPISEIQGETPRGCFERFKKLFEDNGYYITDEELFDDNLMFAVNASCYDEVGVDYNPNLLYHITTIERAKEIQRNGFIPMAKSHRKKYPARVYFFSYDNPDVMLNYMEDSEHLNYWNKNQNVAIIEVDKTKIPNDVKFYQDNDWSDNERYFAVYTYDPIPKEAIKDIRIDTIYKQ